jgi:hypothetical protein
MAQRVRTAGAGESAEVADAMTALAARLDARAKQGPVTSHRPTYTPPRYSQAVGPCPCECNSGGFCGGCGHAGCGGRR